ncbi:MAG: outer membrane lipoprotein carrier protein LolA [Alphaproteobacteria bacterium]
MRLKRIGFILLCLAACAVHGAAPAAAQEGAWNFARLMQAMAKVPPGVVEFREERHLRQLTVPLISEGTLGYTPPSRLEKHVLRPEDERMVIDGDTLTVERKSDGRTLRARVSDHPALSGFIVALRALFAGDGAALERGYAIQLSGDQGNWLLILEPKDAAIRDKVQVVRIRGVGNRPVDIEVLEASGDRTVIKIAAAR